MWIKDPDAAPGDPKRPDPQYWKLYFTNCSLEVNAETGQFNINASEFVPKYALSVAADEFVPMFGDEMVTDVEPEPVQVMTCIQQK